MQQLHSEIVKKVNISNNAQINAETKDYSIAYFGEYYQWQTIITVNKLFCEKFPETKHYSICMMLQNFAKKNIKNNFLRNSNEKANINIFFTLFNFAP